MIAGAIAFVATVLFVPIVKALCVRWRLFDAPGPLKVHSQPIPRLGGVAIVLAIFVAACVSDPHRALSAWPFLVGLVLIWAVGLADDLRGVSPVLRLAAQFAAGVLLWQHGWRLPILGAGVLNLFATCFFVAAITNSINLLEGMDGLAAGVVGIIAAAYLALPGIPANPFAFSVAWSVAAACAGFVIFNFPPAKMFMGDSGSTALGFVIAFLGLDFYRSYPATRSALFFPLLTAILPLLDSAFAVVRRLRSRASPFYGDRRHLYDRMFARGWTPRRIALASYTITATVAAIALLGLRRESSKFWIIAALSIAILIYAAVRLGSLRGDDRNRPAQNVNAPPMDQECSEPSSTG